MVVVERAMQARVPEKRHKVRTPDEKQSDLDRAVELVRSSKYSLAEQEARIRRLESAHLGIPYSPFENTSSNIQTEEAPKPKKRSRAKKAGTIFLR